jgi:hypothetical protein
LGWAGIPRGWSRNKTTATAKTKYRGLSTAQQTVRLSVASVEMTFVWEGYERTGNDNGRDSGDGKAGLR